MVRDTAGEFHRLVEEIGAPPRKSIEEVVAANTLQGLRDRMKETRHFWMGQPGLWRRLLTAPEANRIAAAHAEIFSSWGYTCDPDSELSGSAADVAWTTLNRNNLGQDLAELRRLRRQIREEREQARVQAERLANETATALAELKARLDTAEARAIMFEERAVFAETHGALATERADALHRELQELRSLGPVALGLARQFHAASMQFPNTRALLRQMLASQRGNRLNRKREQDAEPMVRRSR